MAMHNTVLDAIGNTPLIKLRRASEETGCTILGKAEFMNPGQSIKDRAALGIINDAIAEGQLRPGGIIVEGTAGNTGIGLTVVANALGMRTVIVIPETQTEEKKAALRMLGATLVEVPAVPYRNPNNYVKVAARMAERLAREEPNGAIFADQFDNVANRNAHIATTGPEIWEQTDGKVDAFVSAVGTGGTLAGVAMALRERNRDVAIALADVPGAALFSYYTTGELRAEGSSITEGIGQGRITANLEGLTVDQSFLIPDDETMRTIYALIADEGLALGTSSGVNVAGAIRLAREMGPGKTIITMLCDPATRYQSRLFNSEFLRSKGLPVAPWLERSADIQPDFVTDETSLEQKEKTR
jgi:cysteine synthase A